HTPSTPPSASTGVIRQLGRRKSISSMAADMQTGHANGLRRTFGVFQLTMISVGATLGTGILVILGEAVPVAGPAVWLAFVLGGQLCRDGRYGAGVRVELFVLLRHPRRRCGVGVRLVPRARIRRLRRRGRRRGRRLRQWDPARLRPRTARVPDHRPGTGGEPG